MSSRYIANLNSRRTALKMAQRDVSKNKIQSILVIAVIAIPVALASFAFTYRESVHLTTSEKIELFLGRAQAKVSVSNIPDKNNYQYPESNSLVVLNPGDGSSSPTQVQSEDGLVDPRNEISGYQWLTETKSSQQVKTKSGLADLSVLEVEAWNSNLTGRFYGFEGSKPKDNTELVVNDKALHRLGIQIGDSVDFPVLKRSFKVVGVIEDSTIDRTAPELFLKPETISKVSTHLASTKFYAVGSKPLTWNSITKLNKLGFGILSRHVLQNPPSRAEIPLYSKGALPYSDQGSMNVIQWLVLGPIVLLPIVMLTGSAFSFSVRRQIRSLAVMSSLGARKSTLRFVTISNGIWLGFLGGLVGAVLGVAVSSFVSPGLTNGAKVSYPGLHLPLGTLVAIIFAGAFIGALVSAIPARAAAKVDILSAIRGTRRDPKTRKRAGAISLALLALGAIGLAVTVPAWAYLDDQITKHLMDLSNANRLQQLVILGAIASSFIAILGLLIGASWVLVFIRFIFKGFGTSANYATNDLVYNRKRFTSVVASVIATSFLAAVILSFYYTMAKPTADSYRPNMEKNQIQILTTYNESKLNSPKELQSYLSKRKYDLERQLDSAKAVAPSSSSTIVNIHRTFGNLGYKYYSTGELVLGAEGNVPYVHLNYKYLCPYMFGNPESKKLNLAYANNDWKLAKQISGQEKYADCHRVAENEPSSFIVADSKQLRILLGGRVDIEAEAALDSDKAVVFNQGFLTNGSLQLDWYPSGIDELVIGNKILPETKYFPPVDAAGKKITFGNPSRIERIAAVISRSDNTHLNVVISPRQAKKLGITSYPLSVIVNYASPLTIDQKDALYQGLPSGYEYDSGPSVDLDGTSWLIAFFAGIFILSSTLIALILSFIESRADQAALWAVGATQSFRSKILAFQGFALTLVGGLMGSAVGYSLILTLTSSMHQDFALPVTQVLTLVIGIPVLTAIVLLVFTPKRFKLKARLALD